VRAREEAMWTEEWTLLLACGTELSVSYMASFTPYVQRVLWVRTALGTPDTLLGRERGWVQISVDASNSPLKRRLM
jgi:hypothetical protein